MLASGAIREQKSECRLELALIAGYGAVTNLAFEQNWICWYFHYEYNPYFSACKSSQQTKQSMQKARENRSHHENVLNWIRWKSPC